MRRPKIDKHEMLLAINPPHREDRRYDDWFRITNPALGAFRRDPKHALCLAWRHKYARNSLSPFTLAYLTSYPGGPEALDKWLKGPSNKELYYSYCSTTKLPVVNSSIKVRWSGTVEKDDSFLVQDQVSREGIHATWDSFGRRRILSGPSSRDAAFTKHLQEWKRAEMEGRLTDEFVRTFGGHPITRDKWAFLKAMADMYV